MNKELLIDKLFVGVGATIRDAMQVISLGEIGICFVVSGRDLLGVVTDGDIRRALLDGKILDNAITLVMRRDFFSLPTNTPVNFIQKNLSTYKYIPIINQSGELVDLASAARYHQIPLAQPELDGNELEYLTDCIQSGWISSQGKYVERFEKNFGDYVGCNHSLAVANGTAALHLALVTLGIGPGDEVIVPDLTFAAPVNAILYVGATPVLVDVDSKTMVIDLARVEAAISERTRAIIPVHLYGYPVDMVKLAALANKHNLMVIEDCAEAIGSRLEGAHVGTFGDAAIFSFFGNKTITTGEGGMVLFRDPSMRIRAKMLRDHGMSPDRRYWHDEIGFNYRLTNVQAAIGVAQLERVSFFVDRKRLIAKHYKNHLSGLEQLVLPGEPENAKSQNSYWLYTIVLKPAYASMRDELIGLLGNSGIDARRVFYPMHQMPPYKRYASSGEVYENANCLSDGGISLPSSVSVSESEIQRVCSVIRSLFLEGKTLG